MSRLLLDIVGRLQLGDLAAQLIDRVVAVLVLAKLAPNDTHLLAQKVFALALIEHLFSILLDLLAQLEQLELARQQQIGLAQPLDRVELVQDVEPLGELERRGDRHDIGQVAGLIDPMHKGDGVLRHLAQVV